MVQTATLSDVSQPVYCDARERPAKAIGVACGGMGELVAAGLMLVLAPFILLSLAVAFVIACMRLQMFDMENGSRVTREEAHPPPKRLPALPELRRMAIGRSRLSNASAEHLWN